MSLNLQSFMHPTMKMHNGLIVFQERERRRRSAMEKEVKTRRRGDFEKMKASLIDFLKKGGWRYTEDKRFESKGLYVVKGGIGGFDDFSLASRFLVFVRADAIESYAISNLSASKDLRIQIAEYIARANYGMRYGKFEMDWDDGEIRYHLLRSYASVCAYPSETLDQLMRLPASMLHRYTPGFIEILMRKLSPVAAISLVEKPDRSRR